MNLKTGVTLMQGMHDFTLKTIKEKFCPITVGNETNQGVKLIITHAGLLISAGMVKIERLDKNDSKGAARIADEVSEQLTDSIGNLLQIIYRVNTGKSFSDHSNIDDMIDGQKAINDFLIIGFQKILTS